MRGTIEFVLWRLVGEMKKNLDVLKKFALE